MRDRGVIDGEIAQASVLDHPHRDRVVVEQQPERCLAPFQIGDIDPHPDTATVGRAPLLNAQPTAASHLPFMHTLRLGMECETFGDPGFLAALDVQNLAPRHSSPYNFLEALPHGKKIAALGMHLLETLIPENVAVLGV